jgi:glycosyltransferase involved in cell wall biosynthesis
MSKQINKLSSLSIFFPAYNEAGNIQEAVKQALKVAPDVARKYEVLIVNDGSTDATLSIAKRLAKRYKSVRVINQRNKGYGGALKRGFKEAKFDWIFFTDIDLQFDIMELKKFIKYIQHNQLVIGFRLNRAEGFKRYLLAKLLKLWNIILLGFPRSITDIDCAFKLIHKTVLLKTQPLISDGTMISSELLLKAYMADFNIKQIGVRHYQRFIGSPTGSNLKVIIKAVRDTFILKVCLFKQRLSKKMANYFCS